MTGAAAVRRVELHRAPILAQRALPAPAVAGGAAAEFSEQWRGHGGGPDGRGRHGDGWCNDKQLAPYLSVRAEQDRDCLSARFFLQVLSKVLVLMASIVYSSVSPTRGGAVWQLVGLITRRSQVQILPPQPNKRESPSNRMLGLSRFCVSLLAAPLRPFLRLRPDCLRMQAQGEVRFKSGSSRAPSGARQRSLHSNSTTICPDCTLSPWATRSAAIRPAIGAVMLVSIFMASSTISGSPT